MSDNIFVGERLKALRKLKGRTQEQMAIMFGVTKQAVSKWESGLSMPDITLLPSIANYFSVTIDYFFDKKAVVSEMAKSEDFGDVVIKVSNLCKTYNKKLDEYALRNLNLNIYSNQSTAIMGASGSGKSTLLNCACGLDEATSGSIVVYDTDIVKLKEPRLTKFRRENMCLIFQSYNLVDTLNVKDNILLPYKLAGERIDKKRLKNIIDKLGLSQKEKSLPSQLSGGQQQRVAIARALLGENKIIFADEPTGALDMKTGKDVLELLLIARREFALPLVIITHDSFVASKCDIVHFLKDGVIYKSLLSPTAEEVSKIMMELQR